MSDEKHKPWCSEWAREKNGGCICKSEGSFAAPTGSARPPLSGRWRYSGDLLCCGTLRIAALDIDTQPSDEFKARLLEWMCETLNQAQNAPGERPGARKE